MNPLADDGEEEEDDTDPLTQNERRGWRRGLRRRRRRGKGDVEEGGGKQKKYWSTTWGPAQFSQANHPLTIMVSPSYTFLSLKVCVVARHEYKYNCYTMPPIWLSPLSHAGWKWANQPAEAPFGDHLAGPQVEELCPVFVYSQPLNLLHLCRPAHYLCPSGPYSSWLPM